MCGGGRQSSLNRVASFVSNDKCGLVSCIHQEKAFLTQGSQQWTVSRESRKQDRDGCRSREAATVVPHAHATCVA